MTAPQMIHVAARQSHWNPKSRVSEPRPLARLIHSATRIDTADWTKSATTTSVTWSRRGACGAGANGTAAKEPTRTPASHAITKSGRPQRTSRPVVSCVTGCEGTGRTSRDPVVPGCAGRVASAGTPVDQVPSVRDAHARRVELAEVVARRVTVGEVVHPHRARAVVVGERGRRGPRAVGSCADAAAGAWHGHGRRNVAPTRTPHEDRCTSSENLPGEQGAGSGRYHAKGPLGGREARRAGADAGVRAPSAP